MGNYKICSKCGEKRPLEDFYKQKTVKDGCRAACKECEKGAARKYYGDHQEERIAYAHEYYKDNQKELIEKSKDRARAHPVQHWVNSSLNHHANRGCIINISRQEAYAMVNNSGICSICGCTLNWEYGKKGGKVYYNSPTIDRINNENELNRDNIWIVCHKCNATKQDRTFDEMLEYCKMVVKKFGVV